MHVDDIDLDDIEEIDDDEEIEETEDEEPDVDDEPEDLAAAFRRVQEMDNEDPEGDVGDGGDGPDGPDDEEDEEDPEDDEPDEDEGYEGDRGPSTEFDRVDYESAQKGLIESIGRSAVNRAIEEFRQQGIREFTMSDLYERTADGRVVYHNPDDKSRPFANRMEAQQWIDSFNAEVRNQIRRNAISYRNEMIKASEPSINLLRFAPEYDAMDPDKRGIFDDLISDYEVKDRNGKVVGYSCDLDQMSRLADRLAQRYAGNRKAKKAKRAVEKASGPSVDMQTHGSSSGKRSDSEPKTIEEAMLRLREMNKKGSK